MRFYTDLNRTKDGYPLIDINKCVS